MVLPVQDGGPLSSPAGQDVSYKLTGLKNGKTYQFRLACINEDNMTSPFSEARHAVAGAVGSGGLPIPVIVVLSIVLLRSAHAVSIAVSRHRPRRKSICRCRQRLEPRTSGCRDLTCK